MFNFVKRIVCIAIALSLFLTPKANAMLAKYWRIRCINSTDQTLTYNNAARLTFRLSPWKISGGDLSYGTTIQADLNELDGAGESIAINGEGETEVQDNTSNLYWGIKGYCEVIADQTSTDGVIYIFLEESDDNSTWPSDQADFACKEDLRLIGVLKLSTDAEDEDRGINFEF